MQMTPISESGLRPFHRLPIGAAEQGLANRQVGQGKRHEPRRNRSCEVFLGLEDHMSAPASEEIDILEKAKSLLAEDYIPSDDEEYMNERQQAYFQMLLIEWKRSIHTAAGQTLQSLADGPIREADLNDRASSETDWGIELRTRDRQRKLVSKIDAALRRILEGEYGYCEVTGDPIGLKRLIARPVATMTVEAQEAHERREKISRDD